MLSDNTVPYKDVNHMPERLAKRLSCLGICSRREGERFIFEKRIQINGQCVAEQGVHVCAGDEISIDGYIVQYGALSRAEEMPDPKIWLYYKPCGFLVSHQDPQNRPTIFDDIKKNTDIKERVLSVGRLDRQSEGLMLLTNNGSLKRLLEHPKNKFSRVYRVRVFGSIPKDIQNHLLDFTDADGMRYRPIKITYDSLNTASSSNRSNRWIYLHLTEGKNREIRKVLSYFHLFINRLIRIEYAGFHIKRLDLDRPHSVYEIPKREVQALYNRMSK